MTCTPLTLFPASPLYRPTDPDTSKTAGECFAPTGALSDLQRRVLAAFVDDHRRGGDGFTADELLIAMNDAYPDDAPFVSGTIRKRITDLKAHGLLEDSGVRRSAVFSRSDMAVWRLA